MIAAGRAAVWLLMVWGIVLPGMILGDDNILGFAPEALRNNGKLVICGGGEAADDIYDEFIRLAGGKKARIVLISSAFPYESKQAIEERFLGWKQYKLASFNILDADNREEANDDDFLRPLEKATGVWFSGGDQNRLSDRYNGTKTELAMRRVVERGGVVGGTSAGAAFQSQVMIKNGRTNDTVITDGLGLVQRAVIDQHFTQRGRHTRLLDVLDKRPELIGIGVDECTALIVQGNNLRVIGEGKVTVFLTPDEDESIKIYRLRHDEEANLVAIHADMADGTPRLELRKVKRVETPAVAATPATTDMQ